MKIFKFLVLISAIFFLVSCSTPPIHEAPAPLPSGAPMEVENNIIQIGNMTYIPFNDDYTNPDEYMESAMNAVYAWEQEHPDRNIYDVDMHWQQSARGVSSKLYGITIYSRLIEEGR